MFAILGIYPFGSKLTLISRGQQRQTECSPNMSHQHIETGAGLFHMSVSVAALLFQTHYGKEKDVASLATWLDELDRDIPSMWNDQRSQVKDYRAAEDFFNHSETG